MTIISCGVRSAHNKDIYILYQPFESNIHKCVKTIATNVYGSVLNHTSLGAEDHLQMTNHSLRELHGLTIGSLPLDGSKFYRFGFSFYHYGRS